MTEVPDPAAALLEEVRADPYGWHWMDLDRLLDLHKFGRTIIRDAQGFEAVYRYSVEKPALNVVLSKVERVHYRVAEFVVSLVDQQRSLR